ncbi:MAG: peptide chain release factor 3 [Dialister micraerophilus]|nr:peptide chain release factor 3 [Dialister micraerophilus]
MTDLEEIKRRRTFAIISHPDAGKTTLTEKLLLYGGAIHLAGSVKARKTSRYAVSDWMEIEKQRGISVTSSVLQFDYNGCRINILDTPGHADFSEDTYRTLMAVDSAVMVIDVAKGVEAQTKKLFKVCSDRGIPIFTFVNKIDHFGKNPFDLMADIEEVLGIRSCPMNWPIGINGSYTGIYDRENEMCHIFIKDNAHGTKKLNVISGKIDDENIKANISEEILQSLKDDLELLDEAGDPFDLEKVKNGTLTPMFFGSAMTNFGVQPFLEKFLELAPSPQERTVSEGKVLPTSPEFSAFVFKIQANMDPKHHDRIAFIRICSGIFEKGVSVLHRQSGKMIRLSQPQQFLATERTTVEKAYPGDIIGIFDTGELGVGDTICEKKHPVTFIDFPVFPPELFARISPSSSMKRKQFLRGVSQLAQEGAIQVYTQPYVMESFIIGAVGQLQFEVMKYRLENEYSVTVNIEPLPYTVARWTLQDVKPEELTGIDNAMVVRDRKEKTVYLLPNEWQAGWLVQRNPEVTFLDTPPRLVTENTK